MSTQTVGGFARKGDLVAYEDQKNPRREGVITREIHCEWGTQFYIEYEDGTTGVSDCRQHGWTFVLSPEERQADYEAARDVYETDRARAAHEEYRTVRETNRRF